MESPGIVQGVPFKKKPRFGQQRVFDNIVMPEMSVELPTGYGKTFTAFGVFSILRSRGIVDRLLIVVPRDAQLYQICQDGASELDDVGLSSLSIASIPFHGVHCVRYSRDNSHQIYATTIQALVNGKRASDIVQKLFSDKSWMLCVDEYHHYGEGKSWTGAIRDLMRLNCKQLFVMSATPYRPEADGAFRLPDVKVTYCEAAQESAVKPLAGHSYIYKVQAIGSDGNEFEWTTSELTAEAGSDAPDAIDELMIQRQMRWSPKYIDPLITVPIDRLLQCRLETGYRLQALITAMSCSHAEMICGQIREQYPALVVDWVGTGPYGRSDRDNDAILRRFNPDKVGGRRPQDDIDVDVLVHVGLCAEGVDATYVAEVSMLRAASINNTNNQIIGRASRYLPGVTGHINFDSSSEYSEFVGYAIMDVVSGGSSDAPIEDTWCLPPLDPLFDAWDERPIPDEPAIQLWDIELLRVEDGDMDAATEYCKQHITDFNPSDPDHVTKCAELARNVRNKRCEEFNTVSELKQLHERVEEAVTKITSLTIKRVKADGHEINREVVAAIKHLINDRKVRELKDSLSNDKQVLMRHYAWAKHVHDSLRTQMRLPKWLEWSSIVENLHRRKSRKKGR